MNFLSSRVLFVAASLALASNVNAGNKDRTGQAGASELLINPWGQSTGLFGMNTSYVSGIEAMKSNVAGLALVKNLEFGISHNTYLTGSKVTISNLGIAQRIGGAGVLGLNIMSTGFGEITITDEENPQGKGTYKPQFLNATLGFARTFSKNIHTGVAATLISQQVSNIRATGAVFEAGIQYVTGKRDNFHFGVTLRNIGTNMRFSGNGFNIITEAPDNSNYQMNRQTPTDKFEMPTYLNFGASYDYYLDERFTDGSADDKPKHRLTGMLNFTSNSFLNDYIGGGLEYSFKELFMARVAYRYEDGIGNSEKSVSMFTGIAAGASVQHGIGERGPILALDYSYRPTQRPNNGVHVISLRIMTRSIKEAISKDAQN